MPDDFSPSLDNLARRQSGTQQWQTAIEQQRQRDLVRPSMGERIGDVVNRVIAGNPLMQMGQLYRDIYEGRVDPTSPQAAGRGLWSALSMAGAGVPYTQRGVSGTRSGTLSRPPAGEGERAISASLDRMAARGRGNEWVQVPEGGQGIYMRMRPTGIDVANVSFETTGTGAFARYLDHIEAQAAQRGLQDVTVENIFNERLVPFLEKRGFVMRGGDPPSMIKRIVPKTGEGFIDIDRYYKS